MLVKYIKIKDCKVSIHTTQNFRRTLKTVFKGNFFDSRDYLFEADEYIRVFVEDLSLYNKPETLYFYQEGKLTEIFFGTVLFAKTGKEDFEGLSDDNIELIMSKLVKADGVYKIYD